MHPTRRLPTDVSGRRLCGLLVALWAIIIAIGLASVWPLLGIGAAILFAIGCWFESHVLHRGEPRRSPTSKT